MNIKLFLFISLSLIAVKNFSQVFTSEGDRIINHGRENYFFQTVKGLTQPLDSVFGLEEVCVNIKHPKASDLVIHLESPSGIRVELSSVNGGELQDYSGTCFREGPFISVTLGKAPFKGTYKPEGYLGRFNNGQSGNGNWKLIIKDWRAFVDSGAVISWSIKFSNTPAWPVKFKSTHLPLVVINTLSQDVLDSLKIASAMKIIDQGNNKADMPGNIYDGQVLIEYRGASSQTFEKKSYSFTTVDGQSQKKDVSLCGMPPENEWVLYAPFPDKSLIRNYITYELSRRIGLYAPRCRLVELVVNNEYQGVFVLMEKIKRDQNRVNVDYLSADAYGDKLTGGYILKIDKKNGRPSFGWHSNFSSTANSKVYFQCHTPKADELTAAQSDYIQNYINEFEKAMNGPEFSDPHNGYRKYADLNSLIDLFIVNELTKNIDGYRLSTYFYKDRDSKGGKITMGPIWDYDLAWGNAVYGNAFDPTGWQFENFDTIYPVPFWWKKLTYDTAFVSRMNNKWHELRKTTLSEKAIFDLIDSTVSFLGPATERNFVIWPVFNADIYPCPPPIKQNHVQEIAEMKRWIQLRLSWIDTFLPGNELRNLPLRVQKK